MIVEEICISATFACGRPTHAGLKQTAQSARVIFTSANAVRPELFFRRRPRPDLGAYLGSSPSLSSVSESLLARCSLRRSTSSRHSSEPSQISSRRRYPTVSWGNAASHGRLLSTGTHTPPGGSFCTRITHLFINGRQKRRLAKEI